MISRMQPWMIYGANGYTGELIAREAVRRGHRPIVAGRHAAKIEPLARELGCDARVFDLDCIDLAGAALVLHCAGPFSITSAPMVEACLRGGAHYLDITGEISVFESILRRDGDAKARGVTLLPGVGFDVVPTDCLAASPKAIARARRLRWALPLLSPKPIRRLLQSLAAPRGGPDERKRAAGRVYLWGEISNGTESRSMTMATPEGYAFTVLSAVNAAERVLAEARPGAF